MIRFSFACDRARVFSPKQNWQTKWLEGLKRSHRNRTNSVSSNQSKEHFNESDRIVLNKINQSMKHLNEEMKILEIELSQANKEIVQVKAENALLKQSINLKSFAKDDLDQYNRRENIRIYGFPGSSGKKMTVKTFFFQIAEKLDVEFEEWCIQRCHRQGKKSFSIDKTNVGCYSDKKKLRPIIARFLSFKK